MMNSFLEQIDFHRLVCMLEHVKVADPASYDKAADSVRQRAEFTHGRVVYCRWAEHPATDGIVVLVIHVQPPLLQ